MGGRLHFGTDSDFGPLAVVAQAMWVFELDRHGIAWGNAAALRFWKADSLEDLRARDFSSDSPIVRRRLRSIFDRTPLGQSVQYAWTIFPRGEPAPVDLTITPVTLGSNARDALLIEASALDVANQEIEDRRLLEAMRATGTMISHFNLNGDILGMNAAAVANYGLAEKGGQAERSNLLDRFANRSDGEALIAKCSAVGEATEELEAETLNGRRWHRFDLQNCVDPISGERNLLLIEDDQSERKSALMALEAMNASLEERVAERSREIVDSNRELTRLLALLRHLIDNLPVMIGYIDTDQQVRLANEAYARWMGFTTVSIVGMHMSDVLGDRYHIAHPFIERVLSGETLEYERLSVGVNHDRNVRAHYIPHIAGDEKTIAGYVTLIEDVTERQRMQAQLDQAERLAAIGRLTGGVAHDFNNLLGVVMGNVDLLEERLETDDPQAAAIMRAAERGAELTRSLLAFARSQNLSPRTIELTKTIPSIFSMLAMALGEANRLEIDLDDGLWPISADPGSLENALINLAVNARDAMPQGGQVTIVASNFVLANGASHLALDLPPGAYVKLATTDTGHGMSEPVKAQAFEPFFTTKDVGVGTGLGLSMVYGFAKQSGGVATIENVKNGGLTVSLYLPRAEAPVTAGRQNVVSAAQGDGQTVLILEDNSELRALAKRVVESLGYSALVADSVASAWKVVQTGGRVDLLLADVNLPGEVTGPRFAQMLRVEQPDISVVYMSGATTELHHDASQGENSALFVAKPFRRAELAKALRAALARQDQT